MSAEPLLDFIECPFEVCPDTVHLVDEHYDTGPVVLQETVPVLKNDTPEALASRVLEIEHQLYPKALNLFAKGHVHVQGRTISIQRLR